MTASIQETFSSNIFETRESEVRSYSRGWPAIFTKAKGAWLTDRDGKQYLDFFAGAGALNYGHNNPAIKGAMMDHLAQDVVIHSMDMHTPAKRHFLEVLTSHVLEPRGMDHKVLMPGPTGTNTVEAALKAVRKATGRSEVVAFTNGFHGMTLGSLSVTANKMKRAGAGVPLTDTQQVAYDSHTPSAGDDVVDLDQLATAPDVVVVPVGGGGCLSGIAAYLSERAPRTRIIGVEPAGEGLSTPRHAA